MITLGRRQFLHNAGRLMLLPLFQNLLEEKAMAASVAGPWVHLYFPMGSYKGDWKLTSMATLPAYLSNFESVKSSMLWFSDVSNNMPGDGGHEQAGGGALTCTTNAKDKKYDKMFSTSADQIVAKAAKSSGPMTLSRAGFQAGSDCCHAFEAGLNYISWVESGKNMPSISDPTIALKQFFGSGNKVDNTAEMLADGKSSLDFFTAQVKTAQAKIGKDDAARLDQYLQSVRDYEAKITNALSSQAQCKVDITLANSNDFLKHQNTMLDLIALAMQCNVAPAITYIMDFEFSFIDYGFAGTPTGFHNVTHHDSPNATDMIEGHRRINAHYAAQFAKLVKKVSGFVDVNGNSVLDSSIISMGSGLGDSNAHDRTGGIPMVMAGGKLLGVPQGKTYTPKAKMSDILRTVMSYVGTPDSAMAGFGEVGGTLIEPLKKI